MLTKQNVLILLALIIYYISGFYNGRLSGYKKATEDLKREKHLMEYVTKCVDKFDDEACAHLCSQSEHNIQAFCDYKTIPLPNYWDNRNPILKEL